MKKKEYNERMRGGRWTFASALGVVLIVTPGWVNSESQKASDAKVVIVEVQWDGLEYIRLINQTAEGVEMTGWRIDRQRRAEEVTTTIVELDDVLLLPGAELLIGREEVTGLDVVAPSLVLHNDGDLLRLVDAEGVTQDVVGQLGPWFAGKNTETGVPMVRIDPVLSGVDASNWRDGGGLEATEYPMIEEEDGSSMLPVSVEAVRAALIISEVLPNPIGADGEGEFIELYNRSEEVIDVTGWQLDDAEGGSKPYVISEGMVAAESYQVWQRTETGLALNNEGDGVRLISPEGQTVVEMSYGPGGREGWSWNWQEGGYSLSTQVTPGAQNRIAPPEPSPTPLTKTTPKKEEQTEKTIGEFSDAIGIHSFLPNPMGADEEAEYIELENTGTEPVRLADWQLDDAEGGSKPYTIPGEIVLQPNEKQRFERSVTKLALNNEEDIVRLFDPAGEVMAQAAYQNAGEGDVFMLGEDGDYLGFVKSGIVAGVQQPVLTVAQAREAADDEEVVVEGVVVAPPGVLGARVMYIADEDGVGLQIYWSKMFSDLEWWQRVTVSGVMTEAAGERRLRIQGGDGPVVVGVGREIAATAIPTGVVGEAWEAQLVRITGVVRRSSGETLYADDGSGEARIVVKSEAGIVKPRMRQGMHITVTGIVSQTQSGYRLLPRRQEDFIVEGEVAGAAETKNSSPAILLNNPIVLNKGVDNLPLPIIELPSQSPIEHQSWFNNQSQPARREATRNTIVVIGLGLAAVQLIGGARESEPLWKRKT